MMKRGRVSPAGVTGAMAAGTLAAWRGDETHLID